MRLLCRDHVCALLQHDEVQGAGPEKRSERQIYPVQGTCATTRQDVPSTVT